MVLKNFKFRYRNKEYNLKVKICKTIFQKASGLMFKKNSPALLFIYKKPVKEPIHSFFCKPFLAIWFNKNKIIQIKLISSFKFSIKPKEKFDKFLEIPENSEYFKKILDGKEKI